jgi:TPR repeat protein
MEHLMKAAKLGLPEAQHNLGDNHVQEGNTRKAMAWFIEAAQNNFLPSMVNVGMMFLRGTAEVSPNPVAAMIWFRLANRIEGSE